MTWHRTGIHNGLGFSVANSTPAEKLEKKRKQLCGLLLEWEIGCLPGTLPLLPPTSQGLISSYFFYLYMYFTCDKVLD